MFTKITLTLTAIMMLFSLAGCGANKAPSPTTSDASSQSDTSMTITETNPIDNQQMLPIISGKVTDIELDASANGTTQQLSKGQVIAITLESNPSTGYNWYATIADTKVLVQMGEPQFQEPSTATSPVVGAPGMLTIYFQAVDPGTTTVTIDYMRSWEKDVAPEQSISFTVEVK